MQQTDPMLMVTNHARYPPTYTTPQVLPGCETPTTSNQPTKLWQHDWFLVAKSNDLQNSYLLTPSLALH